MDPVKDRIVFLGGLHRSGTTPLARWLATHPQVSGLTDTGVNEDEGQHLQSVYPVAMAYGGPGRFGLDPQSRLTEDSPLVEPDAARRLVEAWSPHWDLSKPTLLEKSPPNLVRMRFLRALFPRAPFIMVVRHPVAVAMATQKWTGTSVDSLLRNWLEGHRNLAADASAVGRVAVVRYEDLMRDAGHELGLLFGFLSLPEYDGDWRVRGGLNEEYFNQFRFPRRPWDRLSHRALIRRYEPHVRVLGYSLRDLNMLMEPSPEIARLRPLALDGTTPVST